MSVANPSQERLGHERVETTLAVHWHLMPSAQKDVAERVSASFTPAAQARQASRGVAKTEKA
jgi:hypothetical protein